MSNQNSVLGSAVRWIICFPVSIAAYVAFTAVIFFITSKILPFLINVSNYFYVSKNQAIEDIYNQTALAKAEMAAGNFVITCLVVGFLAYISAYFYSLVVSLIAPKKTKVLHVVLCIVLSLILIYAIIDSGALYWALKASFMLGTLIGLIASSRLYEEQ